MDAAVAPSVTVRRCPLPDDLVPEVPHSEHRVHQGLQVMARRRVAVEVNRGGRLHHAAQLDETRGHHGQVRCHVIVAERADEGLEESAYVIAARGHLVEDLRGVRGPVPGVLECLDLGFGLGPGGLAEDDVVRAVGVEGRVQIDEVGALRREVAQHLKVVAVVERVRLEVRHRGDASRSPPLRRVPQSCAAGQRASHQEVSASPASRGRAPISQVSTPPAIITTTAAAQTSRKVATCASATSAVNSGDPNSIAPARA